MAKKPPTLYSRANGRKRVTCCYCKRQLDPPTPERPTSLTFDHVIAESQGGWRQVPCCRQCNFLKNNLPPGDWFWFIDTHPRWWRTFSNPAQVAQVVREFRFAQARLGVRPERRGCDPAPNLGIYRSPK